MSATTYKSFPKRLAATTASGLRDVETRERVFAPMGPAKADNARLAMEVARRWNCHAALLAACEALVNAPDDGCCLWCSTETSAGRVIHEPGCPREMARAALAKARP